jgi:hypothetical protein
MLPTEILSLVNLSANNQLSPDLITIFIDGVQKSAFQTNTAAFLQYRQKMTLYKVFQMEDFSYTDCVDSDIGKAVLGADDGTGFLVSFDNTAKTWQINVTTDFVANESIQITDGTGAAQITAASTTGGRGPYPAPTDPACRKVWGITQRKPEQFWLEWTGWCGVYWVNGLFNTGDYQAFWNTVQPFETGLNDDLTNEFTFSFDPSLDATYYWVYWRNPPNFTDLSDSDQIIIPSSYHLQLVLALNDYAGAILNREPLDYDRMIDKYLGGWIDSLRAPFRDQKRNQNMSQTPANGYGFGYLNGNLLV